MYMYYLDTIFFFQMEKKRKIEDSSEQYQGDKDPECSSEQNREVPSKKVAIDNAVQSYNSSEV